MGKNPALANFRREVTITRPYWIAKYPLTFGDYETIMGKPPLKLSHGEQAIVQAIGPKMPVAINCLFEPGQRLVYEVIDRIRKRVEPSLPKGLVVRLPTCAEFYGAISEHGGSPLPRTIPARFYCLEDVRKLLVRKNVSLPPGLGNLQIYGPVGEREPTAWGICDVAGNSLLLDRGPFKGAHFLTPVHTAREKDPLVAGEGQWVSAQPGWETYIESYGSQLRLVIGPDLIKEKGLEDKYKDMFR